MSLSDAISANSRLSTRNVAFEESAIPARTIIQEAPEKNSGNWKCFSPGNLNGIAMCPPQKHLNFVQISQSIPGWRNDPTLGPSANQFPFSQASCPTTSPLPYRFARGPAFQRFRPDSGPHRDQSRLRRTLLARPERAEQANTDGVDGTLVDCDRRRRRRDRLASSLEAPRGRLMNVLRREIWAVDPELPIGRTDTMDNLIAGSFAAVRYQAVIITFLPWLRPLSPLLDCMERCRDSRLTTRGNSGFVWRSAPRHKRSRGWSCVKASRRPCWESDRVNHRP